MPEINWIAVLVAAVASFLLGGLWYSKALFGKAWQRETGLTDEVLAKGNMAKIFGLSFVLALLAAWNFANFLGPRPSLALGLASGASAGLLWVAGSFGINYLFERKSLKLFLINGGYHTLQFTIIGLVLALLPCKDCAPAALPLHMKVERKADHAVSESSCKSATGKTLAEWFKALDKHGGVALGRRNLSKWIEHEHEVELWWATTITNEYEIARGDLAKDGKPKGYSICPTKSIKASPKDCFAAFATAKALDGWFGPKQ